jgi:hypothetical protein
MFQDEALCRYFEKKKQKQKQNQPKSNQIKTNLVLS